MAVDNFIPEVWAAVLKVALRDRYVFAQDGLTNRDYQGDIANKGDTVHINTLGDVTVVDYEKNVTSLTPEVLATTDETMVIDQSKAFAFKVDDIDAAQVENDGELMRKAMANSADALVQVSDAFLAATMIAGAGTVLDPATITTADEAFLLLRQLRMSLNKQNAPMEGRFVVISPEFEATILNDSRFIDASQYGSNTPILTGEIGRAIGFSIFVSNRIPEGTAGTAPAVSNYVIAGHSMGTTYAEQINKVEAFRPEASFADAVKGLHLYGAHVVRPEVLAVCDADVTVA